MCPLLMPLKKSAVPKKCLIVKFLDILQLEFVVPIALYFGGLSLISVTVKCIAKLEFISKVSSDLLNCQ